jgi:hypothetical protein
VPQPQRGLCCLWLSAEESRTEARAAENLVRRVGAHLRLSWRYGSALRTKHRSPSAFEVETDAASGYPDVDAEWYIPSAAGRTRRPARSVLAVRGPWDLGRDLTAGARGAPAGNSGSSCPMKEAPGEGREPAGASKGPLGKADAVSWILIML